MEQTKNIGIREAFETFWFVIKYVVTLENPLITTLVVILLTLNIIHFFKTRTSKEYADKSSKVHELKIFGIIPVEHSSIKDTLIVFTIAILLFGFLMFIFLGV